MIKSPSEPLPNWMNDYTTRTKAFFRDLLNIHNRPENQGLETPAAVEFIRDQKKILQYVEEMRDHDQKVKGALKRGVMQIIKGLGWDK